MGLAAVEMGLLMRLGLVAVGLVLGLVAVGLGQLAGAIMAWVRVVVMAWRELQLLGRLQWVRPVSSLGEGVPLKGAVPAMWATAVGPLQARRAVLVGTAGGRGERCLQLSPLCPGRSRTQTRASLGRPPFAPGHARGRVRVGPGVQAPAARPPCPTWMPVSTKWRAPQGAVGWGKTLRALMAAVGRVRRAAPGAMRRAGKHRHAAVMVVAASVVVASVVVASVAGAVVGEAVPRALGPRSPVDRRCVGPTTRFVIPCFETPLLAKGLDASLLCSARVLA